MFKPTTIAASTLLFVAAVPTHAQTASDLGTITAYTTGWGEDQVKVRTTATFVNPAGCTSPDGYITSPSDPGNHAHQAALLSAYIAGLTVRITVSTTACYMNRPQIIGVEISSN